MKRSTMRSRPGRPATRSSAALLGFRSTGAADRRVVNRELFVEAMRGAATGVNIVTTDGAAGRYGLTVSAFASVSADPPTLLVCINRRSPACSAILANRRFCVNVLAHQQSALAQTFAGMPERGTAYDFCQGVWTKAATGAPVLEACVANFDCTLGTALNSGSHAVFIGLVTAAIAREVEPLVYSNHAYGRVRREI